MPENLPTFAIGRRRQAGFLPKHLCWPPPPPIHRADIAASLKKLLERVRPSTHDEPARDPVKRKLFHREFARPEGNQIVNRNVLYLVIGALAVVSAIFGYQLYQERQKTAGIEINVGKSGISIEKK